MDAADETAAELLPCLGDGWCLKHPELSTSHHPNCAVYYRPAVAAALRELQEDRNEWKEEAVALGKEAADCKGRTYEQIKALGGEAMQDLRDERGALVRENGELYGRIAALEAERKRWADIAEELEAARDALLHQEHPQESECQWAYYNRRMAADYGKARDALAVQLVDAQTRAGRCNDKLLSEISDLSKARDALAAAFKNVPHLFIDRDSHTRASYDDTLFYNHRPDECAKIGGRCAFDAALDAHAPGWREK